MLHTPSVTHRVSLFVVLVVFAMACGGTSQPTPTPPSRASSSGAETPRNDGTLAQRGREVFDRACARCHNAEGNSLADLALTTERVTQSLHAGADPPAIAPAFVNAITEDDVPALMEHLRAIHTLR
jgi:mono/diheme cytochrome c family protein